MKIQENNNNNNNNTLTSASSCAAVPENAYSSSSNNNNNSINNKRPRKEYWNADGSAFLALSLSSRDEQSLEDAHRSAAAMNIATTITPQKILPSGLFNLQELRNWGRSRGWWYVQT